MTHTDTIIYPFEPVPHEGEVMAILPGIRWVRMPLPFALDHINTWLLDDDGAQALVDTGIGNDATQSLWQSILTASRVALSRLVITHGHPDHIGLANWLMREHDIALHITQGEFYGAHALWHQLPGYCASDMVEQFRRNGLDAERLSALASSGGKYRRLVPDLPTSYQRIFDGDTLRIGANDWRIIVGYGHSPEHASLYCERLGVLISGDMLLPRISTNISVYAATPDGDPLAWFLSSLSRLKDLPQDTLVLPSHGRPFRGLRERIKQLERHHAERCDELLETLDTPRQAADVLSTLFPRELDTHQVMFAMGESIAHFNYLVNRHKVRRLVDQDGLVRFERTA